MTDQTKQVLLVDDEEKLLKSIAQRMKVLGFTPHTASNGPAAIEIAKKYRIDLAIVDLKMPDMDGLVVITKLKEIAPRLKTVLLTGHGSEKVRQATESLNTLYFEKDEMGDFWRFIKKLNADGQVVVIHPASATAPGKETPVIISPTNQAKRGPARYTSEPASPTATGMDRNEERGRLRIVGETPAMQELGKGVARAAALDCSVTLEGEPGTGKELAARLIHAGSRYCHKRFLAIDCASFGNTQLAGQLLGFSDRKLYEAIRNRSGIFGSDPVGTLLLDQVEKMPLSMQGQLLETLVSVESRNSGGSTGNRPDIRIILTTEADLTAKVEAGSFSRDLFDRLTVFRLTLPPLRERKDDIHPLIWYFFDKYRRELGKSVDSIAPEVIRMLEDYDFPGNVRELEYIVERAVIIADGKAVLLRHLPARFLKEKKPDRSRVPGQFATLAELEKRYIVEVLDATGNNKSKTAEILGISRAALWRKLKQLRAEESIQ